MDEKGVIIIMNELVIVFVLRSHSRRPLFTSPVANVTIKNSESDFIVIAENQIVNATTKKRKRKRKEIAS